MYRVLYKPYIGCWEVSDDVSLEDARTFRDRCLSMKYPKENVYIVQVVERGTGQDDQGLE